MNLEKHQFIENKNEKAGRGRSRSGSFQKKGKFTRNSFHAKVRNSYYQSKAKGPMMTLQKMDKPQDIKDDDSIDISDITLNLSR